jgi:hypothetical protein
VRAEGARREQPVGYVEIAGNRTDVLGGDLGVLDPVNRYVTGRVGLSLLTSEPLDDVFTGANVGVHVHLPWRVSPFIGVGGFLGYTRERFVADDDNRDNDRDGFVDERGETRSKVEDVLASIYPEAGLLFWFGDGTRLSVSARYNVSTEGRDSDEWLYSVGLGLVP